MVVRCHTTSPGATITLDIGDTVTLVAETRGGLRHGHCETYCSEGDIESIKGEYEYLLSMNFNT